MPQYSSYGIGPIRRRTPIGMNVAAFADAVGKLDAKYQAMAQQQSAIDMALAQLPVNAAEDEWRYNLGNEIRSQIEAVDNPNDRYLTSIRAAGQLMSRPDVIGRIRAEAEYQNFVKQTQARNDIDQRIKNWALETNPYTYEDVRDSSGRIVGGTEWKANNTPVGQVDLSKLGSLAINWAKPDSYKGTKGMFVNSNGELTETFGPDTVDIAYQTDNGWAKVGKDKLEKAINAAIDMTPGARASIAQDYKVAQWDYNKLTSEQKSNIGDSEITDSNGRLLTEKEFLAKKINPWLDAAAYTNVDNTIKYSNGLQTAYALRQQAMQAATEQLEGKIFSPVGQGYAVTYDLSDEINRANGALDDAIHAIEGAAPALTRTAQWRKAVLTKDYDAIERIVKQTSMRDGKNYYDSMNDNARRIVDNSLKNIYSNKGFVEDLYKNMDNNTKEALEFKAAVDAGQKLPDNNQYTKLFLPILNHITNNKPAQDYQIRFNTREDLDIWLSEMGMSEGTARKNGFIFGTENNTPTVTFSAGNNFVPKSMVALARGDDDIFSNPLKRTTVRALDSKGNVIGTAGRGTIMHSVFSLTHLNNMNGVYKMANAGVESFNRNTGRLMTTNQSTIFEHPAIAEARRRGDKPSDIAAIKKDVYETLGKTFDGDWAQMNVYGINTDTNTMTIMHNKDRAEQMHNVKAHIQADKADIQMMQSGPLSGYFVTLHGSMKDGVIKDDGQDTSYFITTGVSDQYLDDFRSDPLTRANSNYNSRVKTAASYRTKLGTNISQIGDDSCLVNGKLTSPEIGKQIMLIDELMTNLMINPNDQVSAARLVQACNGDQQLIDEINNYLTNN